MEEVYHDTLEINGSTKEERREAEEKTSRDKEEEEMEDIYHDAMEGRESAKEEGRKRKMTWKKGEEKVIKEAKI